MLRTIIIDDELHSIDSVELIIRDYCPGLIVIGKSSSYHEGIQLILNLKPDLVFLDIEMPFGSGFDILENIPQIDFGIIFITAYNQYAVKAFRYSAIDYLLKPINIREFLQAVSRVDQWRAARPDYRILLENLKGSVPSKLTIPTAHGYEYLHIIEIMRIEADGRYSRIYMKNRQQFLVTRNIGEFEDLLSDQHFFRIHNSHLVNLMHVRKYSRMDGGFVEMSDQIKLPVARLRRENFLNQMNRICR